MAECRYSHPRRCSILMTIFAVLGLAVSSLAAEGSGKEGSLSKGLEPVTTRPIQKAAKHLSDSPTSTAKDSKSTSQFVSDGDREAFADATKLEKLLDEASLQYWSKQLKSSN